MNSIFGQHNGLPFAIFPWFQKLTMSFFFFKKSHGLAWMNDNAIMPETKKNKNITAQLAPFSLRRGTFLVPCVASRGFPVRGETW